ncbi:hypothetical protein MKW94_009683 [Papaver nudicaule]|uniref:Bms1-type G domain-containing protein n=1 Tax=Papaver nudicaule TaxID=74823 RepID=A0AA41S9S2_PAPNU|nr:hypothetical protein [Papaver nudicaule]
MAFSSSCGDRKVVISDLDCIQVFKINDSPKVSAAAGLQLQSQAATDDDVTVEEFEEPPPYVIVVHGPRKVDKSVLIRSLVKHYTDENHNFWFTPELVMIISGERRRLQFVECPNSVKGMRDAAKYADAVILLIDAYVGFQMETFEFVNILRVHGMPKVIGVLTSLDMFDNVKEQTETKEHLMNYFQTEIYQGAGLFCLSAPEFGIYQKHEIGNLGSFILAMKFHPLSWRAALPYVLVDHFVDVTRPERVLMDNSCNRDVVLYGYLRGCDISRGAKVFLLNTSL